LKLTTYHVNGAASKGSDSAFFVAPQSNQLVIDNVIGPAYGSSDLTNDAGFIPAIQLGIRVWDDQNGDGLQSAGEPGILGVDIVLVCNNVQTDETHTGSNGTYHFYTAPQNSLCTECISLSDPALNGETPTTANVGNDVTLNSHGVLDSTGTKVCTSVTTGGLGYVNLNLNFGFSRGLVLGDFVWSDNNGNGQQDAGEPGIVGVIVQLYLRGVDFTNVNNKPLAATLTDGNGLYYFRSTVGLTLVPNTQYSIVIPLGANSAQLSHFIPTIALDNGADDTVPNDSNGLLNNARTYVTALASTGAPGVSRTW
jgi:hypothetical protein